MLIGVALRCPLVPCTASCDGWVPVMTAYILHIPYLQRGTIFPRNHRAIEGYGTDPGRTKDAADGPLLALEVFNRI